MLDVEVDGHQADPSDALRWMLDQSVERTRMRADGVWFEVSKLEELAWPDDFLHEPQLRLAVGVARYRPDGEPWGRIVVLVVRSAADTVASL